MSLKSFVITSLLTSLVAGHAAIISATGNGGGQGMALGIDSSTPRDGTQRNPFQQDSTRFRGEAAATFGETVGAGTNSLEAGTRAIMAETGAQLPQITPGGTVNMVLHQVNGDGGGPYTCAMNADGTGANWADIVVATTPPGQNSRNRAGAQTDFPLVANVPAGQACTGNVAGQNNVCLVRCQNAARAGPFGGVIPVQLANSSTPAAARRALAMSVKRSEILLSEMTKRASSLSAAELDELREDGEIA